MLTETVIIGGGLAGIGVAARIKAENPEAKICLIEREDFSEKRLDWLNGMVWEDPLSDYDALEQRLGKEDLRMQLLANADWERLRLIFNRVGISLERREVSGGPSRWVFKVSQGLDGGVFKDLLLELGIMVLEGEKVVDFRSHATEGWQVWFEDHESITCNDLVLCPGGGRNHILKLLREMGVDGTNFEPLLGRFRSRSTVWNRSGPFEVNPVAISHSEFGRFTGKLEWSARGFQGEVLNRLRYAMLESGKGIERTFRVSLDWLPEITGSDLHKLIQEKQMTQRAPVATESAFGLPEVLWKQIVQRSRIEAQLPWNRLKKRQLSALHQQLKQMEFLLEEVGLPEGERAYYGGIHPHQIQWNTGELLNFSGLYLAGEVLDRHGHPGGMHLQLSMAGADAVSIETRL